MVHTLDIPKPVEAALRAQAQAEGKSFDALLLEVLAARAGIKEAPAKRRRDLSYLQTGEEDARNIEEAHDYFDRVSYE